MDANDARTRGLPLMLVFAQDHCGYCEQLDREVLDPYVIAGTFDDKVVVRRVMIDSFGTLRDFDGTAIAPDEVSKRFHAYVTPTVIFVDADGRELAPRLVGIENIEFYAAYLEQNLAQARESMLKQQ
jgi:thioredoxin-related protein